MEKRREKIGTGERNKAGEGGKDRHIPPDLLRLIYQTPLKLKSLQVGSLLSNNTTANLNTNHGGSSIEEEQLQQWPILQLLSALSFKCGNNTLNFADHRQKRSLTMAATHVHW